MNIDDLRQIIHEVDIAYRPYAMFIHPGDAEYIKKIFPEIDDKFVVCQTEYVEKGKCIVAKRKDLEVV